MSELLSCVEQREEPTEVPKPEAAEEKTDSSDEGKESASEAGADVQDASSSTKTKETGLGYEEKVLTDRTNRFEYLLKQTSCLLISSNQPHRRPPPPR
ncbi:hypothetical protein F7725_005866 [Dissostichus mawsoni]|uniref:Uncharacterized protein n=1 Tax=Dissostichus mawsoni TaxID=36200 RepID=A0A7J5YUL0_DISMA|nr:hypothetical protein F7725_005866 [Dissostichus mawsoni]